MNIVSFEEDDGSPGTSVSSNRSAGGYSKRQLNSVPTVTAAVPGVNQQPFRPQAEGAHAHGAGQESRLPTSKDLGNVTAQSAREQRSKPENEWVIDCGASQPVSTTSHIHVGLPQSSTTTEVSNRTQSSINAGSVSVFTAATVHSHTDTAAAWASSTPVHQTASVTRAGEAGRTLTKLGSVDSVESALSFEGLKHSPSQVSNASDNRSVYLVWEMQSFVQFISQNSACTCTTNLQTNAKLLLVFVSMQLWR